MTVLALDERVATLESTILRLQGELGSLQQRLDGMRSTLGERERQSESLERQVRAERERSLQLQHELEELQRVVAKGEPLKNDWIKVVGMFAGDPGFDEAVRLGREYRQQQPLVGDE